MSELIQLYFISFIISSVNGFPDVQREFTILMENAHESCQGVIAMCERPFIGFDIKSECSGVSFSEQCKFAACSSELCNLFEVGIAKCHNLCKLGPMNDDCVNCAYLPQSKGIPQDESGYQTALEMIEGMDLGRGTSGRAPFEGTSFARKKKGGKKKKGKKPRLTQPVVFTEQARPVQYRPTKPTLVGQQQTQKYTTHSMRPTYRPMVAESGKKKKKKGKYRPSRQLLTR